MLNALKALPVAIFVIGRMAVNEDFRNTMIPILDAHKNTK